MNSVGSSSSSSLESLTSPPADSILRPRFGVALVILYPETGLIISGADRALETALLYREAATAELTLLANCSSANYGNIIQIRLCHKNAPFFFPGLFFYVYIESPNPKNPEGPTPQPPNPIN